MIVGIVSIEQKAKDNEVTAYSFIASLTFLVLKMQCFMLASFH